MVYGPAFCSEDPGGPISQDRAIKLINGQLQMFYHEEREKGYSTIDKADSLEKRRYKLEQFRFYNGLTQSLEWALHLMRRVVPDTRLFKEQLLERAESLETEAKYLREQAEKTR